MGCWPSTDYPGAKGPTLTSYALDGSLYYSAEKERGDWSAGLYGNRWLRWGQVHGGKGVRESNRLCASHAELKSPLQWNDTSYGSHSHLLLLDTICWRFSGRRSHQGNTVKAQVETASWVSSIPSAVYKIHQHQINRETQTTSLTLSGEIATVFNGPV